MSEHLTPQQIEQYASRKTGTTARELLDFDEHLAGCAECRTKALAASGLSPASISMLPGGDDDPGHLEQELLEGYVDGTLGDVDKEIVEGHLEFCGDCAAEVAELRSFRSMLSAQPDKAYSPDPAAGMYQRMEATSTATRRPAFRFAPAFAMAASILVAAVVVWQIHGKGGTNQPSPQIADMRSPQSTTQAPFVAPAPAPTPPSTPSPVTSNPPPVTQDVPRVAEPKATDQMKATGRSSTSSESRLNQPMPLPPPVALKPVAPAPGPSPLMDNIGSVMPDRRMAKVGPRSDGTTSEATSPTPPPPMASKLAAGADDDKSTSGAFRKDEQVAAQPGGFAAGGGFGGAAQNGAVSGYAAGQPGAGLPATDAPALASGAVGMASVSARNEQLPASVRSVLASGHLNLDTPEIRDLTTVDASANVGEAPAPFSVSSPVGTALLSDRPTFSWEQAKEASAYQVIITDRDGGAVDVSPSISSTVWKADKALPTGQVLKWQVKAIANGTSAGTSPNGGARFRVLDPARAAQIRDAQKTFADQPLALGILYAQAGMLDEAQRALEKAHKQDPQNEIVLKLLADVKAVRDNRAGV